MNQSKLMNKSNQPINQFKGSLVIETANITRSFIFESKENRSVIWSVEIKKESETAMFWFLKKIYERRKDIAPGPPQAIS